MAYEVYITEIFEKKISPLSDKDKKKIQKIFLELKRNPHVGDQIRYKFFREKRMKEKRIYYLIYEKIKVVLIVAFGGKKTQQGTIQEIIKHFPEYSRYVEKLS